MSPGALALDVAGTRLWLRPDGTVWWPDEATLFAADLHLGKGAAFRAQGQPVPAGGSEATLARLDRAARDCGARRVLVLGDFWHHRHGLSPSLGAAVADFARCWPTVLVLGNHDRPLARAALEDVALAGLGLEVHPAPLALGPLCAVHEPVFGTAETDVTPGRARTGFALAGHLHPALLLRGRAGDRLRRPCFVRTAYELVLPSFGIWTGSWALSPQDYTRRGATVAVLGDGTISGWLGH